MSSSVEAWHSTQHTVIHEENSRDLLKEIKSQTPFLEGVLGTVVIVIGCS